MEFERARIGVPPALTKPTHFSEGDQVKILRDCVLCGAYLFMAQTFAEGTVVSVVSQTSKGEIIVFYEGEDWVIEPNNLVLVEKK